MVAVSTLAGSAPLLFTALTPSLFTDASTSCLAGHYYGLFGGQALFLPSEACLERATGSLTQGHVADVPERADGTLVWVEEAMVEDSVRGSDASFAYELDTYLDNLRATYLAPYGAESQTRLSGASVMTAADIDDAVLMRREKMALLHLPLQPSNELLLNPPRLWKVSIVDGAPQEYIPVPHDAVDRVRKLAHKLSFDPVVGALVGSLSVPQMRKDIAYLTGEADESEILSRHSFAQGSRDAADWLKGQFESLGATCELKPFLLGFAPNVICKYPATRPTNETVLLSAHYDSRGSFGSLRAPGGDDDGSGTTALLAIARQIYSHGVTFQKNVEICAFAGEEQGLLGSKAYARELRAQNANLTLMIQADMLAYRAEGEPPQLGLPDLIGTPEVAQLVSKAAALYAPELSVGYTPACCSDHQSFHEQGFPATQVFERAGPIVDPMYHNSGDLSQRAGYDFEQLKSIAKVQFATLLHSAGYELPETQNA